MWRLVLLAKDVCIRSGVGAVTSVGEAVVVDIAVGDDAV